MSGRVRKSQCWFHSLRVPPFKKEGRESKFDFSKPLVSWATRRAENKEDGEIRLNWHLASFRFHELAIKLSNLLLFLALPLPSYSMLAQFTVFPLFLLFKLQRHNDDYSQTLLRLPRLTFEASPIWKWSSSEVLRAYLQQKVSLPSRAVLEQSLNSGRANRYTGEK